MIAGFLRAFEALPLGRFTGHVGARRYIVVKSRQAQGASEKLVAEELGGPDYISFNLYRLASGPRLRPCEMSRDKVMEFVIALRPERVPDQ